MKNIILQGLPGIGKTTIIKKVIHKLDHQKITGFYTEEVRNDKNQRIGFDIISTKTERGILARKRNGPNNNNPMVGQYTVYLSDFEQIALPIVANPDRILIIDEIGKMELFSKKFEDEIKKIIQNKDIILVATVPLKSGAILIKQLKESKDTKLISVDEYNRNQVVDEITDILNKI